jgi:DNA-binding winged helix-turn-helix (wHTH) protein
MSQNLWAEFPQSYCTEDVQTLLSWVAAGESGTIVGWSGTGKSNLLGFLANRPDVTGPHLPDDSNRYCFLLLDVNSLPEVTVSAFYRGMLQTLYEATKALQEPTQGDMAALYHDHIALQDPFLLYQAIKAGLHLLCAEGGRHAVWLLDRFDAACRQFDRPYFDSLRALRDTFKGRLCYLVATRHELARLRDPTEISEFYDIVATHIWWVRPLGYADARWVITRAERRWGVTFSDPDVEQLIALTGGHPRLLRTACDILARESKQGKGSAIGESDLLARSEIRRECQEVWGDLGEEERQTLRGIVVGTPVEQLSREALVYLQQSGLVSVSEGRLQPFSSIFGLFVAKLSDQVEEIRLHPETRAVLCGSVPLPVTLTPKEDRLLSYFLEHVGHICTKDALIRAVWPDEVVLEGVRDDRLTQLVRQLRVKIEPDPADPRYIRTVWGRGYRFVQPDTFETRMSRRDE